MKTSITKKTIKSPKTPTSAVLQIPSEDVLDQAIEVLRDFEEITGETRYKLEANINASVYTAEGNDSNIFSRLEKPPKFVTKGIFKLTNKVTGKSFEIVYPPFLSRKLLINPFVQTVQWKRMSAKVD